jgi:hypothetical protein
MEQPQPPRRSSGWTDERRARQAEAIRRWAPWANSTGPRTADGKAISSRNARLQGARAELSLQRLLINDRMREACRLFRLIARQEAAQAKHAAGRAEGAFARLMRQEDRRTSGSAATAYLEALRDVVKR